MSSSVKTRCTVHCSLVRLIVAAAALSAIAHSASAELIEKSGRFGGLDLTYKVLVPPGYDPAREYPAVLVFTGGPQRLAMAENTINTDWRAEAETRGYIVISPAAPDGSLFFEAGDRVFPELLDAILEDYNVAGRKLHIAGHSNGGLSAFHIAAKHPSYFSTVTGYPGLLNDDRNGARIEALEPMCLFMHVGDQDQSWMSAMQRQAERLKQQGYRVTFTVERNQAHRLRAPEIDLSTRLFDEIESCK